MTFFGPQFMQQFFNGYTNKYLHGLIDGLLAQARSYGRVEH